MASSERQQIWALVVWHLRHGDFIAVQATDHSMSIPTGEVLENETLECAASRICREHTGLEVGSWQPSKRNTEAAIMTVVITEAPIELDGDSVWIDVDQLPLMSAIASNLDLIEAYLSLPEAIREAGTR